MTQLERSIDPPGRSPFSRTMRLGAELARPRRSGQTGHACAGYYEIRYLRANVGFCSTYSIFTCSGPQTKIASVFGPSTTSATSMPGPLRVLERLVRGIDEHCEVVEQRPLGVSRLALVELDERAADLDPRLVLGREPELLVLLSGLLRRCGEERHVVEVVLDVGLTLDETEPQALGHVEVGAAVLAGHVEPVEQAERLLEVGDAKRDVLERAPLARALFGEERQLAPASVRPDQRELVRSLDDVHREPLGHEVRDPVAVGDPERDVVESLGPHSAFTLSTKRGPDPVYFLRLTAARSCRLFIVERPLMFRRFAWL